MRDTTCRVSSTPLRLGGRHRHRGRFDEAQGIGISRASLYRLFEPIGRVARAIREVRLREAQRDLQSRSATRGEIGLGLCFSSGSQFSHAFKAYYGCSPRWLASLRRRPRGQRGPPAGSAAKASPPYPPACRSALPRNTQ
ncbi:helix-turn-helix domain-containing protein [Ancylobacter sp. Lp-2]|uniref:helix-turn-helix domain-containing protein n=1 Tax=Ancylobacter sp. Lp-2 TaxID=2881339 RepID=UPI00351D6D0A|nr:helix-turn-helix domain-containing protein [Ancylobacter sp. Lp-2]